MNKQIQKGELIIVGIEIRTTNESWQSAKDIPALWCQFMEEKVIKNIPNKLNDTIYTLYTDYESDHTKPYTTIIGCQVTSLDNIPDHLTVKIIPSANYLRFIAKGDLTKKAVVTVWNEVWESNIKRAYTTDIEIYDERAIDPTNGIAEILIAI